ncbi:MAG: putative lipid II flippase FtsW [Armatimonadota bacterium]
MRRLTSFDMPLLLCILILVGLGIAFIFTASYPKAMALTETGGNSFFYAGRQIIFAGIGFLAMYACMSIPLRVLRRLTGLIIAVMAFLLILVLVIGTAKHGNKAWIEVGPFQFQPSEFVKAAIVLTLPAYLAKRPWMVKSWRGLFSGPIWFLLIPVGLIVLQGDLGSAFVVAVGTIALLAISGTRFRFWGLPTLALVTLGALVVVNSHRAGRIQAWLQPFDETIQESYQPRNSLLAVGSGELLGRGFCNSRQKYFYLPAAHNDYIFAIVAEELGFVKTVLLLLIPFMFFVYRGFTIAHRARDEYSAMVAAGCTAMLASQVLVNMAVVLNLIPSMGINLPFISYGGSSIIASMMLAGLLLNVSAMRPEGTKSARARRAGQPVKATV